MNTFVTISEQTCAIASEWQCAAAKNEAHSSTPAEVCPSSVHPAVTHSDIYA